MRLRPVLGAWLLVGALAASVSTSGGSAAPQRQWAIAHFEHPTEVWNQTLMGAYLVVHDDAKAARGEPCTSFYTVETASGPHEVVSFHCVPRQRPVADRFGITTRWDAARATYYLSEYQFAGDSEAHGVPRAMVMVSDPVPPRAPNECVQVARR